MSLAADKKRWNELHAAYEKASEAVNAYDRQLHSHYGKYETQWLTKTQRAKLEALQAKKDKIGDKIYELLERVSPRDWSSGVPSWWVRSELTWEDAVRPKNEPLSVVPPTAWGSNAPMQERTVMPRRTPRKNTPESAGSQYATDQLASEYFAAWVRDQMIEASRADPSEQLPLETKADARVIAKNMLKQLEWGTKRELRGRELTNLIGSGARPGDSEPCPSDVAGFYDGFRKACDTSRDWLADELLTIKGEMGGGGMEASRHKSSHAKYRPGKLYKHLKVDRVVPSHNAHRVEFNDGFSIQVHSGSGRDDILYAMRPYDTRLEQRAPGPESRRDYQYAALKAVLDGKPADFVVDHDGDVQARLTAVVRETHHPKAQGAVVRSSPEPVDDPNYIIQGLYEDGYVAGDSFGYDDEGKAIQEAEKMASANWFEGDYVRVITRDGELVWDSRGEDAEERRRPRASEKHRSPPITRVVISKVRNGWIMKVYDSAGHLRSGVSSPSSLEYVKGKAEEWFPGVPVEQEEGASSRPKAVGSVRRRR